MTEHYTTLADYYKSQPLLPTYARLQTAADLAAHAAYRQSLLNDKLYLPARLFHGARLIEFGPDGGENALAFAQWGAHCTLVEPNAKAHPVIREYFQRYGLAPWLEAVDLNDISTWASWNVDPVYDFVVAEGFVYTVKPTSLWINLFARLLRPGGLALINYCEQSGAWIEMFSKSVYQRVKELTDWPGEIVADKLFGAKWDTISHSRTIDQWRMDVLDNPFMAKEYFLDAELLCQQFEAAGFRLYSSWPQYRNAVDVTWHKTPEQPGRRELFINAQRKYWQYGNEAQAAHECIERLADLVNVCAVEKIIEFCNTDKTWLGLWGMPWHFGVFQKVG